MNNGSVTNEMLYELIRDFKAEVYRRFEYMDLRIDKIENQQSENYKMLSDRIDRLDGRMDRIDSRMDRTESQQSEDRKLLMDIWKTRDVVTVKLSRSFAMVNAFISAFVAVFVSLFVKKQ